MAKLMGEVAGLSTAHITGVAESVPGAPRPYNSQLDCSVLEVGSLRRLQLVSFILATQGLGIGQRTPFRAGIAAVLAALPK